MKSMIYSLLMAAAATMRPDGEPGREDTDTDEVSRVCPASCKRGDDDAQPQEHHGSCGPQRGVRRRRHAAQPGAGTAFARPHG